MKNTASERTFAKFTGFTTEKGGAVPPQNTDACNLFGSMPDTST